MRYCGIHNKDFFADCPECLARGVIAEMRRTRFLSVNENYNLQEALKTVIKRYGFEEVKEMIGHLEITHVASR